MLKDGYAGLQQRRDTIPAVVRQVRLTEAPVRLVERYGASGNHDEAARWRQERDAVKAAAQP